MGRLVTPDHGYGAAMTHFLAVILDVELGVVAAAALVYVIKLL